MKPLQKRCVFLFLIAIIILVFLTAVHQTSATLSVFILAMILYPEVQKRAQAEIDSVIGSNLARLPVWEDRSSLPYIDAVVKETLRWYPISPLGREVLATNMDPINAHSMT